MLSEHRTKANGPHIASESAFLPANNDVGGRGVRKILFFFVPTCVGNLLKLLDLRGGVGSGRSSRSAYSSSNESGFGQLAPSGSHIPVFREGKRDRRRREGSREERERETEEGEREVERETVRKKKNGPNRDRTRDVV